VVKLLLKGVKGEGNVKGSTRHKHRSKPGCGKDEKEPKKGAEKSGGWKDEDIFHKKRKTGGCERGRAKTKRPGKVPFTNNDGSKQ